MPFRFPLASVLRYREELERREERALEQKREALALLQNKLATLAQKRDQLMTERAAALPLGLLGDDLHHFELQSEVLKQCEEDLKVQIAAAQAEYDQQMAIFLVARQKREILEELRDSRKASYLEKQNRREQQNIDEIFSARLCKDE